MTPIPTPTISKETLEKMRRDNERLEAGLKRGAATMAPVARRAFVGFLNRKS
jgi:hypothetical protein